LPLWRDSASFSTCACVDSPIEGRTLITALFAILLTYLLVRAAIVCEAELPRPQRSYGHEQGDDHLLERPRNTGRDPRGRSGCRDLHRARALARRGGQRLQGPGIQSAARHAIGLR